MVKPLEGTLSAYAERVMGGTYLDFDIDREAASNPAPASKRHHLDDSRASSGYH